MPDWSLPPLLLLLLALPLLRWLHRERRAERELRVSALFLWPQGQPVEGERRRSRRVDPRWWLRALIAALLVLAAAGPQLQRPERRRIDVYLDDSPSMAVREAGHTRLELALERLAPALEGATPADLRVLSLGRRRGPLALDPERPASWAPAIAGWVRLGPTVAGLPGPAQLAPGREAWLVTDGADPRLLAWLRRTPAARVIRVGELRENAAVIRLSVRPLPTAPGELAGLVRVANGGAEGTSRHLRVARGELVLVSEPLQLAPGESVQRSFRFPERPAGALRATLVPGDALPGDDELLLLAPAPERLSVRVDPACGPFLRGAVRAHPALTPGPAGEAELAVWCSANPPPGSLLWFRPGPAADREGQPWPAPAVREEGGALRVVLAADPRSPGQTPGPEYALAVAELLDLAAGRSLLEQQVSAVLPGEEEAVPIAPLELPALRPQLEGLRAEARADLSGPLVALAGLLLLLDTWWTQARP
jgi:hypothetical protein